MRSYFKQQSLFRLQLNKRYYLELTSGNFIKLNDAEGNPLTLYESDYNKLHAYLKSNAINHFSELSTLDKLIHLEKAKVRVTRYFTDDHLQQYELNIKASMENKLTDIISQNGMKLTKGGHQNCVVVYQNHVYMHPKIRCVTGDISHEVLKEPAENKQPGTIGVSHSSLCHGRQVSFAGSFVYDDKKGWTVENTSGHYITRAYQVKELLNNFDKNGLDLSKLTIKFYIPNNPTVIPTVLSDSDYHIIYENAADYLNRMQNSQRPR